MQLETIETGRLLLKKVSPQQFRELFATRTQREMLDLLGLHTAEQYEREKDKYEKGVGTYRSTAVLFVLVDKDTQRTIGHCGFHNWFPLHRRAEVGYIMVDEEAKNKGYMSEALSAIIHHGFTAMDLNRIEAYIAPTNVPSLRLVAQNGFQQEGVLRQHFNVDGHLGDSVLFGLLKEEWQQQPQTATISATPANQ